MENKYKEILKKKKFTLFCKRCFDILFSFFGILLLLPLFIIVYLLVACTSKGGGIYKQVRVGKNNMDFKIYKFRTMVKDADRKGLQISTSEDARITKAGKMLRKTKIDELPQLFNVLIGNMSFVGPRPEVREYVDLYNEEQKNVLLVKPGITEIASIKFRDENEILSKTDNPRDKYITDIMPIKINYGLEYIENFTIGMDVKIILCTVLKIKGKK